MELNEIVNLIMNSGVCVLTIAYFMYRDFKFMGQLTTTLQTLVDTVNCLKEITEGREE